MTGGEPIGTALIIRLQRSSLSGGREKWSMWETLAHSNWMLVHAIQSKRRLIHSLMSVSFDDDHATASEARAALSKN
jgi:hypothetical protein